MTTAKKISKQKANKILHEGMVRGHKLTNRQRKFMGAMASGSKMRSV